MVVGTLGSTLALDQVFARLRQNLDRDVVKFPELLGDTAGGLGSIIESKGGTLVFCTGYLDRENCYQRVGH